VTHDILLGVVIGAHGLKGEVKVKIFTETPLASYGALHASDGREIHVVSARPAKPDIAIVRLHEIADCNAAAALKGVELFVSRAALPPTGTDEFYHADLVGLGAIDSQGRAIGTVKALHNFGAGDVIEITQPDGGELFLSFTRETVPNVDLKTGRVVVALPHETDAGDKGRLA
jgi:16S rRNA processing protein RimM